MHKTATGTVVAGPDLFVKTAKKGAEMGGKEVPQGRFCRVGFCILDDGERHAILRENEQIDICSWKRHETHTKNARNIPVSTRPFLCPAPAQFCFEKNRFGIVSELDGTVVVTCCGNRTAGNREFAGEVIRRENIEWLREPALTRWDGLGGRGRDRCMTSMKPETNSLRPRMKTTIRTENL